jgi:hypothetical protein
MIDKALTWTAYAWIAVLVIANIMLVLAVDFEPPELLYVGWLPIVSKPYPMVAAVWWASLILALPAVGMFKLRNHLRRIRSAGEATAARLRGDA